MGSATNERKNISAGFVNVYELDESFLKDQKTLVFDKPSEEWVNFVMKNRFGRGYNHDYDIVYGPVANDKVYTQFILFEGGFISLPTLITELKAYKLLDQYLFHTPHALQALTFLESFKVSL